MSLNYSTDLDPFYTTNILTDTAYRRVNPASLRDQTNEKRILLTLEVIRAHMETLDDVMDARLFHQCVCEMMAEVSYSNVYTPVPVDILGNVVVTAGAFRTSQKLSVTTGSGTATVTLRDVSSLARIVSNINSQLSSTPEVQAYLKLGQIGFKNPSGQEGEWFTLADRNGPSILNIVGVSPGTYRSAVQKIANAARDRALAYFSRHGRPVNL